MEETPINKPTTNDCCGGEGDYHYPSCDNPTGEWTREDVYNIVAMHNAAVAAEREKFEAATRKSTDETPVYDWESLLVENEELKRKQDAALEDFKRYHHNPIVADLNKQLAAERERYDELEKLHRLMLIESNRQDEQLAAEREKIADVVDETIELEHQRDEALKQLAAELEIKSAEKQILLDEIAKNKTLRDALTQLLGLDIPPYGRKLIETILAEVKE